MEILVSPFQSPDRQPVELVERKGLGHPDTMCDRLAERLCLRLSRYYLDTFGTVLHHNVDKALLFGGVSRPRFGGGEVIAPAEIYLAGRAVVDVGGRAIPVSEMVEQEARDWMAAAVPGFAPHVRVHGLIRPGSTDLRSLLGDRAATQRANDTSCGAGFAPLTAVEALVLKLDARLHCQEFLARHPAVGPDTKIMLSRRGEDVEAVVSCAMVGRALADAAAYLDAKTAVAAELGDELRALWSGECQLRLNGADDAAAGSYYLTVTGCSAENGDDGQVGRGNRANGLITPYRPMTMEAVAGKNPVNHVGKLYNLAASLLAAALVEDVAEVSAAECFIFGRIGDEVGRPRLVHARIAAPGTAKPLAGTIRTYIEDNLPGIIASLTDDLLAGRIVLDQWPLRRP